MQAGESAEISPRVLEYAGPMPPVRWLRTRKVLGFIRDLGPIFPRPSVWTIVLLAACVGASGWLAQRPQPWRLVRSYWSGQTNGAAPTVQYLPDLDAIIFYGSTGRLCIVRPWTDELLMELDAPSSALPPNPPPGRSGEIWWLEAS